MVGAQMRYLIGSEHGWLGGLGFGASAIRLGDRDQWIGWDVRQQREHMHRVIGMSRFLIRPSVRCHNLASMVLGMTLRSVAQDFEDQYKYRPWLVESFVDSEFFAGTCYQATNWVAVGKHRDAGARTASIKTPRPSGPSTCTRCRRPGAPASQVRHLSPDSGDLSGWVARRINNLPKIRGLFRENPVVARPIFNVISKTALLHYTCGHNHQDHHVRRSALCAARGVVPQ